MNSPPTPLPMATDLLHFLALFKVVVSHQELIILGVRAIQTRYIVELQVRSVYSITAKKNCV
jgi:hypothetical protein